MDKRKIHYISGLTLTVFIGLHLFNHFMSIFGVEIHLAIMNKLRLVYRNSFVEFILLTAVITQIFTGVKLFMASRKSGISFYRKMQIWTGLYLAFFLSIHVSAVLAGRFILNLDTNIYFGAAGLNTFPFYLFFLPYYSLAILSFFGHVSAIHNIKMKNKVLGLTVDRQSGLILIIGLIITAVSIYGLTNGFTGIEIPEEYSRLYE